MLFCSTGKAGIQSSQHKVQFSGTVLLSLTGIFFSIAIVPGLVLCDNPFFSVRAAKVVTVIFQALVLDLQKSPILTLQLGLYSFLCRWSKKNLPVSCFSSGLFVFSFSVGRYEWAEFSVCPNPEI